MKKRILSMALVLCMVLTLLPVSVLAADPAPVMELWVGSTQVVQSGGTVTANTSGTGWSYDSATATLTLNGATITTIAHDGVTGESGSMDYYYYYGIYCYGDLNIVVTGDSSIDARAAADRSCGLSVNGNLSVSGSAELTTKGNWRGLFVNESLSLSGAVTLSGIAGGGTDSTLIGVYVVNSITVSDTASLLGHALSSLYNYGVRSLSGNITIGSEATLTGIADSYTGEGDGKNYGVTAGNVDSTFVSSGQVNVEGTMVARAGNGVNRGNTSGLYLYDTNLVVSNNGSVRAECGDAGFSGATAYGVNCRGNATITVNAGGFRASGGTCAVNPSSTNININGTPVYYEVSANRDGSGATVCTDTDTWNSTYNGNFGAYKYINATTLYEVYVNGTQVTRVNRHDVLGDGTVSYLPAADGSPARLTLSGGSLTTLQLDGDTEFDLTGTSTVGTVTNARAVTVSGSGGLTLTGNLNCGSDSLTVESGAALTTQGTVTAGAVVNGGRLINEGTLILPEATTVEQIQAMNLTGDGIVKAGSRVYLGGILYADGGDKSSSGIDLSTLPSEGTYYKAGSGYALFTPATADPEAKAKLELHNATINTTSATAISLPSDAPVDIVVAGDSSITVGGSANVIYTNGQALSITGVGDLTLAGNNYGINVNGTGAVGINIDGDLTFDTVYQPISTGGNITVSAKSITSNSGYYFQSGGGSVSLTATDGDIVFDETGKTNKSYKISASQNITMNAPNGKIDITHGSSSYALSSISGTVNVTALNDVIINAASGGGGISASSGAVSLTSQTGSIQMNCGNSSQCIDAGGAVNLNAADDITLNVSGTSSTAIRASGQIVNVTAGGTLTSNSAYGFQVGALTIKANEVSIEGTVQDGIYATSVSITNPTGGNCERVSVTGTRYSDFDAAIRALGDATTGNITVKADDLFICGKGGAKAISALGTVTIGGAGMIVGEIVAGTESIDSRILRAAYGDDIGTSGLDLSTDTPDVDTYYTAGSGYILWNPTDNTITINNAAVSTSGDYALLLPAGTDITVVAKGDNTLRALEYAISNENGSITVQGDGTLTTSGDYRSLFAKHITITGSARVAVDGIDNHDIDESSITVSGSAALTSTKSIYTGSYLQSGSAAVSATAQGAHGIRAKSEIRIDGGSLTASSNILALSSEGSITLGSGRSILTPTGGKIASAEITLDSQTTTITSVIPAEAAALIIEMPGETLSTNGATNVVIGTAPVTPSSGYGGGSSGGSSASSTVNIPVSGGSGSTNVSASVSGGTATVSASDAQLKEITSGSETSGTVKIDLSALKADTAVIPAKIIQACDKSEGLSVALPAGTVTLDKSALEAVSGKGDIKLSVETVDNTKLTDAQKAALGTQAGTALVVDVNILVNGTKTSTFGDGKITVSVPYTLKPGESGDRITVWFVKDDGTIEPKTAVYSNGKVTFTTEHLSQYLIVSFPFTDVAEEAWYYSSVAYAYNNSLFAGTSNSTFEPGAAMTREMIWMVLARMSGRTPADMDGARAWAKENGISDGSNPTNSITREQMAAILYRYAQYKNYDTTQGGMAIREFADYDSISEYALPAIDWTVRTGLIKGSENHIMPSGNATRAEVAAILQRFFQNVAK